MILHAAKRAISRWIKDPASVGAKLAEKIDWRSAQPGRITVLCLERSQFIKDIEELCRLTDINWVTLSAVKVKVQQERWVPEDARKQGHFSTWLREDKATRVRSTLESFGVALLKEAQRTMPIHAVAAANMDYWQDEALKLACNRLGIPFLVLCRENYTIPWTVPWHHDYIARAKFRFEGSGLAVFSETTKVAILPAVSDPDDIWVTGAPRYDRWLNLKPSNDFNKTHLSLITFNDPGYQATNTFLEVFEVFSKVARAERHDELTWLVKCKKKVDRDEILERIEEPADSPLVFEYDTPLFDLYPRSRVVIGYNSLALLEVMLTDAPVIIPCWNETRAQRDQLLLDYNDPLTRRVVNFADTPEQFADLLTRAARGEKLPTGSPEDRRALFEDHIFVPGAQGGPQTASAATEAFVRHYIERARRMT